MIVAATAILFIIKLVVGDVGKQEGQVDETEDVHMIEEVVKVSSWPENSNAYQIWLEANRWPESSYQYREWRKKIHVFYVGGL